MKSEADNGNTSGGVFLDQFSTSPTKEDFCSDFSSRKCAYNAPYFAYKVAGKTWAIVQGNCHHWDCPRCGIGRAKQEYGRIVEGCRTLAETSDLYFLTITCRGRGLGVREAEDKYLEWTNRFLDACRQRCKRAGGQWYYVQVTERQKRKHPHSHILTTFNVGDLYTGHVQKWNTDKQGKRKSEKVSALRSEWIAKAVKRAGLGEQYDVSRVEKVEGVSRYVAKYLFKDSIFTTDWPKGWKRVRYSQSFPKMEERKTDAMVLLTTEDWHSLARRAVVVQCPDFDAMEAAKNGLWYTDTVIRLKRRKSVTD